MSPNATDKQLDYIGSLAARDWNATAPVLARQLCPEQPSRYYEWFITTLLEQPPSRRRRRLRVLAAGLSIERASELIDELKGDTPTPPPPPSPAPSLDAATLKAAAALTHPDRHPAERKEQATKVTALLNAAREGASA